MTGQLGFPITVNLGTLLPLGQKVVPIGDEEQERNISVLLDGGVEVLMKEVKR